jgi:hypothetical protein
VRTNLVLTLVLVGCVPLAAVSAVLLGASWWAAALGAALVLVYWGLDRAFAAIGQRGSMQRAVAVSMVGVVVRLTVVGGALAVVGLLARPEFVTCVLTFLAVFTALLTLRIGVGMRPRVVQ